MGSASRLVRTKRTTPTVEVRGNAVATSLTGRYSLWEVEQAGTQRGYTRFPQVLTSNKGLRGGRNLDTDPGSWPGLNIMVPADGRR